MNFLLSINKKNLFIFIILLAILIIIVFALNFVNNFESNIKINDISKSTSDIVRPKFSITGAKNEISITAKNGNFISEEKILLENNVKFKSKDFQLVSDNVIFDRKNLEAKSNDKSKFLSKNTSITSAGFDIIENGNIIYFRGKTVLIIK